jgi:phosphate transport system protein
LEAHDLNLARQVYQGDALINARRFALEQDAMITIATQQPIVAHDLRMVACILEVVGEMERMGDYAKGIAKIVLKMGEKTACPPPVEIQAMAEITGVMLKGAVDAFIAGDAQAAAQIPQLDDQVDALYNQVYQDLVAEMIHDPGSIDHANFMMWAAHNLERMADRVGNICERTVYTVTGVMKEIDAREDYRAPD